MPRPRISSETEDLLKELDEILAKLYEGVENPKVLKESKGRGSGDYTYTQDSLIKYALTLER